MTSHVETFTDPAAATAALDGALAADPVRTSIVATNLIKAQRRPGWDGSRWFAVRDEDGATAGVGMWTLPHVPHVASPDPQVGRALADHLAGEAGVTSVTGIASGAQAFADRWVERRGGRLEPGRHDLIYDLPVPVRERPDVPGASRPATDADRPLLDAWARAFVTDIGDTPDPTANVEAQLADGDLRVWEVDGRPVAMAYASPPAAGHVRLSWVYTPDDRRGRGYAGAVTGAVAAAAQAAGHDCLLYADRANPASNAVYRRLGFRVVAEAPHLRFVG